MVVNKMMTKVLLLLCCTPSPGYSDRSMVTNPGNCCVEKIVDMDTYILVETPSQELVEYNGCASACLYKRLDDDGRRWCFGAGGPSTVNSCTTRTEETVSTTKSVVTETFATSTVDVNVSEATSQPASPPQSLNGLLMMGGFVDNGYSDNVELYGSCGEVVSTNKRTIKGSYAQAVLLGQKIYICGGDIYEEFEAISTCYIRDMAGNEVEGPSMNTGRYWFTLSNVDSKLVAIGGYREGSLDTVEVLEPGSNHWQTQSYHINPARDEHCAVTVSSSSIMLIGGFNMESSALTVVEELNILTGEVTSFPNLEMAGYGSACLLYQNKIIVTGGSLDETGFHTLDISVPGNGWEKKPATVSGRYQHIMAVINGVITVYSGFYDDDGSLEEFRDGKWILSPAALRFGSPYVVITC